MIYIFVEGDDDKNFFEKIILPIYPDYLQIIEYSQRRAKDIQGYIHSINSMPDADYLFFGDEDGIGIENKKNALLNKYSFLDRKKLFIVQYEIESWYYAGVCLTDCKALKLTKYQEETNSLTKEQFYSKLPSRINRKEIMLQMLDCYSKELAEGRNRNFYSIYRTTKKEPAAV